MRPFVSHRGASHSAAARQCRHGSVHPARFMKRPRSAGLRAFLLHDLRNRPDGAVDPDNPLDDPKPHRGAEMLVARRNFGCGSSREAAVYALADYGLRA